LLAYSTFKASKCIYMEAAGVPKDEWAQLVSRRWGATELFDAKDATHLRQRGYKGRVSEIEPHLRPAPGGGGHRRGPLLCNPAP
jgi:hypothetical protein